MLLSPSESLSIAEELGIPVPPWDTGEGSVSPPAYVKADVPIPHKTEVGAVYYVENEEELRRAVEKLKERYGKVIVQKAVKGDLEVLVSSKVDDAFGKVAVIAMGGLYASVLKESIVTKCPVCEDALKLKLGNSKIGTMLRHRKRLDEGCLIKVVERACLAEAKTFEVNPLVVSEKGCWAVDVKVWL